MDLQPMAISPRSPGDYAPSAGGRAVEAVRVAAEPLRGARFLHVSAAGSDGRVPELLGGLLPLAAGAGVEVEWRVLFGPPELRTTAGALAAGLRGGESAIADESWEELLEAHARTGRSLGAGYDAVVLHGPALALAPGIEAPCVWRCHDDLSRAEPDALGRAAPLAASCALVLVPDESFAPPGGFKDVRHAAAAPGIDPLDARNLDLEQRLPGRVVRPLGVDLERPFCLQLFELDRWDDPHPTIEAFRLAREDEPELQLVLAALLDSADGSWAAAKEISDYAGDTADIRLVTSYEGLGSLELGALHVLARVTLERSLSEGFELAPCESLWRRTPVVGGALPAIVRDGVEGYLTETPEETARRLVELVRDPGLAAELGRAGRERVRERFLVTGALERELRALVEALAAERTGPPSPGPQPDTVRDR